MTDRPMDASATEHPEEGLIHAWLDDALGAADAERLAAHVQGCAECQARVAEARGLIAGASRIVAALDDVQAGARPGWAQAARVESGSTGSSALAASAAQSVPQRSLWRWLRVTPGRAALAATILVAIGITLTHDRVAEDSVRAVGSTINPQQTDVPASTPPEGGFAEGAKEAKARDELLDSAVARSVAATQGRAKMEAASGPSIPQAPPPSATVEVPTRAAAERVARGRAVAEAQRETASVTADRLRVGNAAGAGAVTGADEPAAARSQTRIPVAAAPATEDAMMARESLDAVARSCLRLESTDADARWADQPFPMVLVIDPGPADGQRTASVLTVAGQRTPLRASWLPREGDSVSVTLRRIGYSGTITLGPERGARSGIAVSAAAPMVVQGEIAAAAPSAQQRARADGAREESRRSVAAPQPTPAAGPPLRELRVTARKVSCPE